jgi:uncharacterized membrane protein SirB2
MISYQIYKVMHIASIFFFLTGASVLLLSDKNKTFWKILTGVSSLFILIGGMGLMARLGAGFQPWIQAKLVIWFVVTGLGHLVAKRFASQGSKAYWVTMLLAITAAALAIYKPYHGTLPQGTIEAPPAPSVTE